ncbi:MAG: hypothetical protein HKO67_06810 [Flavobacteriaceae bacterium]|nr:hypothetical protein [Flavobacteriaceae bacterium]
MKTKFNALEIARFMICVGIAWIAWMTHYHTGAIFLKQTTSIKKRCQMAALLFYK